MPTRAVSEVELAVRNSFKMSQEGKCSENLVATVPVSRCRTIQVCDLIISVVLYAFESRDMCSIVVDTVADRRRSDIGCLTPVG